MTELSNMFLVAAIAEVAHEANRVYCVKIGDDSGNSWTFAPDWQQESTINGVKFVLANPNATPKDCHKHWKQEKFNTGWEYGKEKDINKKQHPRLVPYEDLPVEQKIKDSIFVNIVKAFVEYTNV